VIYSIRGILLQKGSGFLLIEVGGVGFKVFANAATITSAPPAGQPLPLFCHLHVQEDALDLYGFLKEEELQFFEQLILVSGVGPKSAVSILNIAPLGELLAAVKEGRPDLLSKASGIGRKTAERIIVELKSKVEAKDARLTVKRMEGDADLVEALAALGYRREKAKEVLAGVSETDLSARLKAALKVLSGKR
jgi:Holliday junction DNA helicase RuvA